MLDVFRFHGRKDSYGREVSSGADSRRDLRAKWAFLIVAVLSAILCRTFLGVIPRPRMDRQPAFEWKLVNARQDGAGEHESGQRLCEETWPETGFAEEIGKNGFLVDPASKRAVLEILRVPQNIYVTRAELAEEILSLPDGLSELQKAAKQLPSYLDQEEDYACAMMDRIVALDFIEEIAGLETNPVARVAARTILVDLFEEKVPRNLGLRAQAVMVSGKRDALSAMIRTDPLAGLTAFRAVENREQKAVLKQGVILALMDLGLTSAEAVSYVAEII